MPVPAVSDSLILLHGHRGRPKADKKQKVREISDFTNFLFTIVPKHFGSKSGSAFDPNADPNGMRSGKCQTARERIFPMVCAAFSCASVVTWV